MSAVQAGRAWLPESAASAGGGCRYPDEDYGWRSAPYRMVDEDSMYLYLMNEKSPIDLNAIIFAGIIIGAIGAIMDVSMSLSSSLQELKSRAPEASARALFRSG